MTMQVLVVDDDRLTEWMQSSALISWGYNQ